MLANAERARSDETMAAHNLPAPRFSDLYAVDTLGKALWHHWLNDQDSRTVVEAHLRDFGVRAAQADAWAAVAEKHPPVLRSHDLRGDRIDRVEFHPAYHELERLAYGGGIVALKYESSFLERHGQYRHLAGFGAGYYFAQAEAGLYCPICMTDGVGWVLEKFGHSELAREALGRIASRDPDQLWQGAMFLTERQGGSDVGANEAQAWHDGAVWRLRGHKWFCSNVSADVALVLARMPNGPRGTAGLGLFSLVPSRPAANLSRVRIERLKEKFGTRSMATGEVTLDDAEAELLGGVGEGFKMMLRMVSLSRTYNAVASVAAMRRAVLEALSFGSERTAFGQCLWDLPLWRASLADLQAEAVGAFVTVFGMVRLLDRQEAGDAEAGRSVRLLTPLCKAMTAKLAVYGVTECMEAVGGNGFIETSALPRLLRDTHVLPIWEGTTNVLALDFARAVQRDGCHAPMVDWMQRVLDGASNEPTLAAVRDQVAAAIAGLGQLGAAPAQGADRWARVVLEQTWRGVELAFLLEAARAPTVRDVCLAACRRLAARPAATAALGAWDIDLGTEEPLLQAGYVR